MMDRKGGHHHAPRVLVADGSALRKIAQRGRPSFERVAAADNRADGAPAYRKRLQQVRQARGVMRGVQP
jgi:hypothetical protein